MYNLTLLVVLFAFASTSVFSIDPLKEQRLGGTPANPGEYPYAVFFKYENDTLAACSGSIIGSKYILTQAYCADSTSVVGTLNVMVGCVEWNSSYCQPFQVQEAILHPAYNNSNVYQHNIAVLVLTKEIPLNMFAQIIPLSSMHIEPNSTLNGIGMDQNDYVMKWQTLKSLSNSDCSIFWPFLDENSFCTVPGNFVSPGAFGAPVTVGGHQVGIGNRDKSTTDLILRIQPYIGFIFGIIQANSSK